MHENRFSERSLRGLTEPFFGIVLQKGVDADVSTEKQVPVVRVDKSVGLAYLLLIFLGQLGAHRFYLN